MGRCGSCQSQTQLFCFVHQEFVCDLLCLTKPSSIHSRCIVNTYREFVKNNSYEWPPVCAACNCSLLPDDDHIRRTCLHVEHVACINKSTSPSFPCASCNAPLFPSTQKIENGSEENEENEKELSVSVSEVLLNALKSCAERMPSVQPYLPVVSQPQPQPQSKSVPVSNSDMNKAVNTEFDKMTSATTTTTTTITTPTPPVISNHIQQTNDIVVDKNVLMTMTFKQSANNSLSIPNTTTTTTNPSSTIALFPTQQKQQQQRLMMSTPNTASRFGMNMNKSTSLLKALGLKMNLKIPTSLPLPISTSASRIHNNNSNNNNNNNNNMKIAINARKIWKAFSRRVLELRNTMVSNGRQTTIGILFIICVLLILLLGDESTKQQQQNKTAMIMNYNHIKNNGRKEPVFLPHVRVNPAIIQQQQQQQQQGEDISEKQGEPNSIPRVWRDKANDWNADGSTSFMKRDIRFSRDARHDDRKRIRALR